MAENENAVQKRDNRSRQKQSKQDNLSGEIINTLETIEEDYSRFKDTINNLKNNLQSFMDNTHYELGEVKQKTEQKAEKEVVEKKVDQVEGEIDEVDERLNEVMREVGFGEEIDVSNIPPVLLEGIYQKILNEIIEEMRENLGNHEANLIIQEELENMRMRTSGSELFQYDGRDINIRNLVSSIENNLISSKQIHSTFRELVQKLSERIPNYNPRNFRAMVNAEGLEFVIKKTITLLDKSSRLEEGLEDVELGVKSIENELENKYSEMETKLSEIEEKIDKEVTNKYTDLNYRVSELEDMFEGLDIDEISEGLKNIKEKNEVIEERIENITSDFEMSLSIVQEDVNTLKESVKEDEYSLTGDEKFVYYAIPNDGATLKKLQKEVGDEIDDVESDLESLCDKGKVEIEKRGRWTVYVRSEEQELEDEDKELSEEGEDQIDENELEEIEVDTDSSEEEITESDEDIDEKSDEVEGDLEEKEVDTDSSEEEITESDKNIDDFSGIIFDKSFTEGNEVEETVEEVDEELDSYENDEESKEIEEDDITDKERLVIDEIPDDGCTIHQLDKQFEDYDKSEIEEILEKMVEKNKVSTTKRNRWTIYLKQKEVE